jgi:hypothetical protein
MKSANRRLIQNIVKALRRSDPRAAAGDSGVPQGLGIVEGWRGLLALTAVRRKNPPLPPARSVMVELAGHRTCGHRQHRSRLSADQQVVNLCSGHDLRNVTVRTSSARSPEPESRPKRPRADEMVLVARLQALLERRPR